MHVAPMRWHVQPSNQQFVPAQSHVNNLYQLQQQLQQQHARQPSSAVADCAGRQACAVCSVGTADVCLRCCSCTLDFAVWMLLCLQVVPSSNMVLLQVA